ncbi:hypothetical protein F0562_022350 [Nyssa sinensis]|uniref:Mon2/Sec7/BIG1-like HDS domain-containing protein n=1 Tax=Nyssa sinensis TaxID=561372 RepID=A0A5J5BNI1_9ASTE|nr:hypothetical protein F0562_022350 [Nyssa sinensis]
MFPSRFTRKLDRTVALKQSQTHVAMFGVWVATGQGTVTLFITTVFIFVLVFIYIVIWESKGTDSRAYLDHDIFAIMSGPTIVAIFMVFDHAEYKEIYQTCINGFLAVTKISAGHHLEDVLDNLMVSLCKFTTLLNPSSVEEPVLAFGDDTKARMATITVCTIANRYGDFIRTGWRNILDCILKLHKLGLLPTCVASNAANDSKLSSGTGHGKPLTNSLSSTQGQ